MNKKTPNNFIPRETSKVNEKSPNKNRAREVLIMNKKTPNIFLAREKPILNRKFIPYAIESFKNRVYYTEYQI
jgi:hypothetical protein